MASKTFSAYFPQLLMHEGGYVDHPHDPGGATKYGITIQTLKDWREAPVTKAQVKALTKAEAFQIYRENYWNAIDGDRLPLGVDAVAFDIAVNHGVGRWKQWKPIIADLSPEDAVKALCERRRRFYRSLKTFPTFGKGWMRRANEVEKWALKFIAKLGNDEAPSSVKEKDMSTSKTGHSSIVAGGLGAVAAGKEVVDAAKTASDAASDATGIMMSVGPWVVVVVVIIAACAFIWWDRKNKMEVFGI